MSEQVQEIVSGLVKETLQLRGLTIEPSPEMSLIDSGMLDSLSIVTFVGSLEKAFGIEISMSDMTLDNFDNVQLISELVRSRLASK